MDIEQRAMLRAAIDSRQRARMVEWAAELGACGSCGAPRDCFDPDCKTCYSRRLLADPHTGPVERTKRREQRHRRERLGRRD